MDLKRGIDLATANVVDALKSAAREVKDSDEVAQVGTISANGEEAIGNQIADAMQKVGNEGVITVEENKGLETETDVSKACSSTAVTCRHTLSLTLTK